MSIPRVLQDQVRQRAKFRCEYCRYPELLSSSPLSIDHIQPQSLGGTDSLENLALACRRCNEKRYNFTTGIDPKTGTEVLLFNPRQQQWADHFAWSANGILLIGTTSVGRATCNRFDLNDDRRPDRFIQKCRQQWLKSGLHPPEGDPRQLG